MASSLIRGRYLVRNHESIIPDGALYQENGRIVEVGRYADLCVRYRPERQLGSDDFVVIPGLVDCHQHGRGVTTFQLGGLDDCLEAAILRWRGSLLADSYLDNMLNAIRLVEAGVTTTLHSHISRKAAEYETRLEDGLRAYVDLGIRVCYAVDFRTRNNFVYQDDRVFVQSLPREMQEGLNRFELIPSSITLDRCMAAFDSLRRQFGGSDRVRVVFAPSAPQWCPPEALSALKRKADDCGAGLQIHVLETPYQKAYGLREHGKSLVEHLRDVGVLGQNVSLAHAVWATEKDLDIMANTRASVAHCPSCNLRLKSGIAPVTAMLDREIPVGIGTDSAAINDDGDMIQEMRLATKLHRQPGIRSRSLSSREALRMATSYGARIAQFGDIVGTLDPGRAADAVLLRADRMAEPYLDSSLDIVDAILYRAKAADVDTVVVGGEPILQGGRLTKVDKHHVVAQLGESLRNPPRGALSDLEAKRRFLSELAPFVAAFYSDWLPELSHPYYVYNSRE